MATAHAHPTFQETAVEDDNPSLSMPASMDPDLLLPIRDSSPNPHRASQTSFLSSDTDPSPPSSNGITSHPSVEALEIGTAESFLLPTRPKPAPPLSNPLIHGGYEHGAPLSDIGEEDSPQRSRRVKSRTPSPTASSPTIAPNSPGWWTRKPDKRLSQMSTSSSISIGSDLQWEGFDPRAGMSERLKADLAAEGDDNFNLDGLGSRRNSTATNGDEEYTSQALSKRAEQILANAKKRLTVRITATHWPCSSDLDSRTWKAT
jgi:hypothetical protein